MGLIQWGGAIRDFTIFGLPSLEFLGFLLTFVVIVYNVPQYISTVYKIWIAPAVGRQVNFVEKGQWALITGASEGIGRAFAEELAKRGLNVILISRTRSKLEAVAKDLEERYQIETQVIAADFSNGVSVYDTIRDEIQGLEIGTLVNNVGMTDPPEYFLNVGTEDSSAFPDEILFCNVFAVTRMTRMILPQMVSREKGIIINVGSFAGITPTPCLAVYSATKAYVDYFTQSLKTEYEKDGIIIQSLLPGFVYTKLIGAKKSSFTAPTPGEYVRSALKTVGVESRTTGFWTHRLGKRGIETMAFYFPKLFQRLNLTLFDSMRETWR